MTDAVWVSIAMNINRVDFSLLIFYCYIASCRHNVLSFYLYLILSQINCQALFAWRLLLVAFFYFRIILKWPSSPQDILSPDFNRCAWPQIHWKFFVRSRVLPMDQGSSLLSELRQQCGDFFYGFDQNQLVRQLDLRSQSLYSKLPSHSGKYWDQSSRATLKGRALIYHCSCRQWHPNS